MAKIWMLIEDGEDDKAGKTLVKISGDFENDAQKIESGEMTNAQMIVAAMCCFIQQSQTEYEEIYGVGSGECVEFWIEHTFEPVVEHLIIKEGGV